MTVRGVARDTALGLAGLAGLACVLWLLASTLLGWSMVIFRTGSMAPTMPTGTAAIAVPVTAEDIAVGDVLFLEREDRLPITHRVVTAATQLDGSVMLTLKGDANEAADPRSYHVEHAQRIVFPVPGLGYAVTALQSPVALGLITLGATALVLWAFWPRRELAPLEPVRHSTAPRHLAGTRSGDHS